MSLDELERSFYEDDEYRSKRYPNMSGGQEDAAASPDERDDKKGIDEPRSQHALRHQHQSVLEAVHGKNVPNQNLPVLINIHKTQIEILKTLKILQGYQEYQIPLGQIRSFTIPYKTGAVFTHIDFADSTQTFGLPSGISINEPNRKACKLKIFNDGPGTIKFCANLPRSDQQAEIQLNAGEFDDSLSFIYNIIWSLNISVSAGGAPNIRVFYVV